MLNMKYKKLLILLVAPICLLLASGCNSQPSSTTTKGNSNKINTESTKYIAGKDYTEFVRARIMDKVGFQQPVEAFSLLIPKDWTFYGDVMWNPPGTTCAGINQGMKATSSDGKYSFEMMPNYLWGFITDPQLAEFNRQQQYPQYCSFGEPMNAEAYLKNVFAPNELGNPKIISIKETNSGIKSLQENAEKARQEMMGYGASEVNFYPSGIHANVKWNDGSEAIVLCGVTIMETVIPNNYNGSYTKNYTTVASERIVFRYPTGEYEKAATMLSVIMGSIRTNPTWKSTVDNFWRGVREKNNRDNIGRLSMIDEQTRKMGDMAIKKGNDNLNAMDANMRSWEASQASQDRIHTNFIKTIREVENYQDETGKVEMVSGYNHAWSRSDGSSFMMSDNPNFDPSSVFQDQRWKEMKKVD